MIGPHRSLDAIGALICAKGKPCADVPNPKLCQRLVCRADSSIRLVDAQCNRLGTCLDLRELRPADAVFIRRTMKSAFFATIFVIVGGVAILLASPAGDKRAALEFRQARAEIGLPPQIEDDVAVTERDLAVIPEPVDQYSSVQVKPKIRTTTSRHRHVARRHLNFLEKLVSSTCKNISPRKRLINGLIRPLGAGECRKSDRRRPYRCAGELRERCCPTSS